jgi:hypothetical protein
MVELDIHLGTHIVLQATVAVGGGNVSTEEEIFFHAA